MADVRTVQASRPSTRSREMTGGLIGTIFGLAFIEANSAQLPHAWQAVARVGGAVLAAILISGILRARRMARSQPAPQPQPVPADRAGFGRGYWMVVAAEVIALVAGLIVIGDVMGAHSLTVAWIAIVVGVHFFGLGVIWKAAMFHALGAAMTAFGAAGCVAYAAGAPAWVVALVSGIASGLALYAAAARSVFAGGRQPA